MARERVTLVLGGGGVRGIAHVGVLRALDELGIEIGHVVGTSIGAMVGAAYAAGVEWHELAEHATSFGKDDIVEVNRWALLINGIRQSAVFQADRLEAYIERTVPEDDWSALRCPLSMNAVDLKTGETAWFGSGGRVDVGVRRATYASAALPLYYPPAHIEDGYYVDGGIVDPLPVRFAASMSSDPIVAVELASDNVQDPESVIEKGLVGIHHRVVNIIRERLGERALDDSPDRVIEVRPELSSYSTWDFEHNDLFMEYGYRAARSALERALPALDD